MRIKRNIALLVIIVFAASLLNCGKKKPKPEILNINSSTNPSSPVNLAIEINGINFATPKAGSGTVPGEVIFTDVANAITASVVPTVAGWTDTGIVAVVPDGDGINLFPVPVTVQVTVKTPSGTSNAIDLDLVATVTFDVNNVTWTNTAALPVPIAGHRAVALPSSAGGAFIVLAGGYDGTSNVDTVYSNGLFDDGQVDSSGANWAQITAAPLPAPRAHHAMVVAHSGNSIVAMNSAFVYIIAGQELASDTPGGTSTVYRGSVNTTTGVVSGWTALTNALPAPLVGASAALFNGYIYVVGGLDTVGTPSTQVFSAKVNVDGSIDAWVTSPNPYPVGISFASAFGFGGKLYVLGGDDATSTDPNAQGANGVKSVRFATARGGEVGTWTTTAAPVKSRKKHIAWSAFGQVIQAEGIYEGLPGSTELERSLIQPDGTLSTWVGITAAAIQIGANVYNGAAVVSPLQSPTGKPRFLLIGGQVFTQTPPGALTDAVYFNNSP